MPFPLAAMAAINIGGNLLGGLFGKKSADRAADAQAAAAAQATAAQERSAAAALAEQRRQYDLTRSDAFAAEDRIRSGNQDYLRGVNNQLLRDSSLQAENLGGMQNRLLFDRDRLSSDFNARLSGLSTALGQDINQTRGDIQNALTGAQRGVENTYRQGMTDITRRNANAEAGIQGLVRDYGTQSRELTQPYRQAGVEGIEALRNVGQNFRADPGYEFRRSEGNRGIEGSFAAQGGALSGNALRALNEFNSGLASQEYNNYFNRDLSRAQNLANLGQFGTSAQLAADQYGLGTNANAAQNFAGLNQSAIQNATSGMANAAQNFANLGVNSDLSLNALQNQTQRDLTNLGINADMNIQGQTLSGLQNLAGLTQQGNQFNSGNYLNALTGVNTMNANAATNTAGMLGNLGQNYANSVGNLNTWLGGNTANNALLAGGAQAQGIQQGTNSLLGGFGSALQNGLYGLGAGFFDQGRATDPYGRYTPQTPNINWLQPVK